MTLLLLLAGPALAGEVDPKLSALAAPRFAEEPLPPFAGLDARPDLAPVHLVAEAPLSRADLDRLAKHGVRFEVRADGSPRALGAVYAVDLPWDRLEAVAADPAVRRLESALPAPVEPPTYVTADDIGVTALRDRGPSAADGLTGAGVTILDIDAGVDLFHPALFNADGGAYDWLDVDGDGRFDPSVDGVDLDDDGRLSDGESLVWFDAWAYHFDVDAWDYAFDFYDGDFDVEVDWLFADLDGDGERAYGPDAGFGETDPSYGEPFFIPDDADGDGILEEGERLLMLGTSKVARVREGRQEFVRGENLLDFTNVGEDASHGTGVAGILVGGQRPGQRWLVGMAPDAELLVYSYATRDYDFVEAIDWGLERGARVAVHEWAPWSGQFLDGSSALEQAMDAATEAGMVQVSPAGNLAAAGKRTSATIGAGETVDLTLTVPDPDYSYLIVDLKWRQPQVDLEAELISPQQHTLTLDGGPASDFLGFTVWTDGWTSDRGTRMESATLYSSSSATLETGAWTLRVTNPSSQSVDVTALLNDYVSGWGRGITWDDEDPSGTICLNATADSAIAVAAYAGRWDDTYGVHQGELRLWSSQGPRIDDGKTIAITAPDDPYAPIPGQRNYHPSEQGYYGAFGGTSGAGPHVAGAAALLLQAEPELDAADVAQRLIDAADPEGEADLWGAGRLDAWEAVTGNEDRPTPVTAEVTLTPRFEGLPGGECLVLFSLEGAEDVTEARWDLDHDGAWDLDWGGLSALRVVPSGQPFAVRVDVAVDGVRAGGAAWGGTAPERCLASGPRTCGATPTGVGGWLLLAALGVLARRRRG
ncbi:MAG: S8 family serine peptidase [Alphaproteobacteria bacterium]|nr:S8 family serine peptidase [Alphaproteobacteria bacterium]